MTWSPCRRPDCDKTTPVAEDPDQLEGPEVGDRVIYHDPSFPRWDGVEMRATHRSYVWSPEIHVGPDAHGYRRYDWTVVEWDADNDGRPGHMVVDDDKLEVVS